MFATIEDGAPVNWEIVERRLARDGDEEAYLDLVAERDYGELEGTIDHELEHALEARDESFPAAAADTLSRAERAASRWSLSRSTPARRPTGTKPSATSTR